MQKLHPGKLGFSRYGALTLLLLFVACLWLVLRQPMMPAQLQQLEIAAWCDGQQVQAMPTDFRVVGCQQQSEGAADPQHRLLWLQLLFELPLDQSFDQRQQSTSQAATELAPPQALFISARASNAVYLNGQLIGRNGRPGLTADEVPGAMDSRFYLPPSLLRPGQNQLVLQMSAQHAGCVKTHISDN